jgi:O-antigen/teichoic acid export membrane protein
MFSTMGAMSEASVIVRSMSVRMGERFSPVRVGARRPIAQQRAATEQGVVRRRGIWALADQGVVSMGNCATSVILARSLSVGQFGLFAILLEVMLFLNSLQAAVVIYPLSVKGAKLDTAGLRRLAGACLLLTCLAGLPLAGTLVGASGALHSGNLMMGILAGCALILWQGQETLRRAMMSQGDFKGILPGDIISYTGQAVAVMVLGAMGALTINRAFAIMGLTSLLAIIVQALQIGVGLPRMRELPAIVNDFWNMGRWVLIGSLTAIITTLSLSWTMAYFHGVDGVGQFQAMAGVLKLSNPLMLCLSGLIVPAAARALREGGLRMAEQVAFKYAMGAALFVAPYYAALIIVPSLALRIFYGRHSPLIDLTNELRVFVLSYSALFVAQVIGCFLNGIEQSRRAFAAQVAQTAATILVALPLTALYGLPGLLVGWLSSNVVLAASYICILRRVERPNALEESVAVETRQSSSIAA